MNVKDLTPRIVTTPNYRTNGVNFHSAYFGFGNSNMSAIAREWNVEKSNAKDSTIMRGVTHWGDSSVASKLVGHRFLVDRQGRAIAPFLGFFTNAARELATDIVIDGEENFYQPEDMGDQDVREAVRYKCFLKKLLLYSKLVYCNPQDQSMITFEVTGQQTGEGLIQAIFGGGVEEADLFLSFTEITNFSLSEFIDD